MKTCFATVIYKQAGEFLKDFVTSVDSQTDKDFDLVLINDNFSREELQAVGVYDKDFKVVNLAPSLKGTTSLIDLESFQYSIAEMRIQLLELTKRLGYELVIIGDVDDTFAPNRVEELKKAAELDKESVFFYNKLIKENGEDVFKTLPEEVFDINQIAQENFLGMSTTAIRVDKLSYEFLDSLREGESNVFDWYLYSRIVLDMGRGKLVSSTSTIYRIYDNNEAGTTRDLEKEKQVKTTHYWNLAKRYPLFYDLSNKIEEVDTSKIELFKDHQGYWWSDIKLEYNIDNC